MSIYATADLHLSGEPPAKPMEIFGEHWRGHKEKIKADWLRRVAPQDTVIICGDISWAQNLDAAFPDLAWLAELPGSKILLRGNHDYWWSSLAKMRKRFGSGFEFLQNNCLLTEGIAICGSRGWLLPTAEGFTPEDEKILKREAIRLELSLEAAKKACAKSIVVCLHYPPLFKEDERNLLTELLEKYAVTSCVFGHIHGELGASIFEGIRRGISYKLVSCDTQDFRLYKLK